MTDEQLTVLAERFCATPLPATVCADGCAVMPDYPHQRYGTNLLTVAEAKEMLAAMLAASPAYTPRPVTRTDEEEAAKPRCGCDPAVARRVIIDHGTCGMGGCPYGGDF